MIKIISHCLIGDQIEIEEREALLEDLERQTIEQQDVIQSRQDSCQPTRRATLTLVELHLQQGPSQSN